MENDPHAIWFVNIQSFLSFLLSSKFCIIIPTPIPTTIHPNIIVHSPFYFFNFLPIAIPRNNTPAIAAIGISNSPPDPSIAIKIINTTITNTNFPNISNNFDAIVTLLSLQQALIPILVLVYFANGILGAFIPAIHRYGRI